MAEMKVAISASVADEGRRRSAREKDWRFLWEGWKLLVLDVRYSENDFLSRSGVEGWELVKEMAWKLCVLFGDDGEGRSEAACDKSSESTIPATLNMSEPMIFCSARVIGRYSAGYSRSKNRVTVLAARYVSN